MIGALNEYVPILAGDTSEEYAHNRLGHKITPR
jgi:hypothetical protein